MPVGPDFITDAAGNKIPLYSPEGFVALSELWLKVGWSQQYPFSQQWLGFDLIQLPQDVMRMQRLITAERPSIIVETGVSGGGSMALYAHLALAYGGAKIIGIEKKLRPDVRDDLQNHPVVGSFIHIIEGDSTDTHTIDQVAAMIAPTDRVCVILDSGHRYDHVMRELQLYGPFVTAGSFLMVMDGSLKNMAHIPNGKPRWASDNPHRALHDFLVENPHFALDPAAMNPHPTITLCPDGVLRRGGGFVTSYRPLNKFKNP